jgi:hypothetical protein
VGAAAYSEVDRGLREVEVVKEGIGHIQVIVLAGVHDNGCRPGLFGEGVKERGDFHEVRPGSRYQMNKHKDLLELLEFVGFLEFRVATHSLEAGKPGSWEAGRLEC